ncbi:type II toxin-antitoxin system VapC family toxin [Rhodococcus spelaei]|uniref:Ribonuclease VapC n=1 Tax=Rhodococcus spelaei TaxID=2546320 RepID=A0A541B0H3_9NOCA|nr:type II toxin-antitoxin system VapC family toxin [Rhodococcus spelaei]TQF65800.1 type II toxin-antitoxin system VapC family toxin [Rhodococcus spelaei]
MTDCVLDASALLFALLGRTTESKELRQRLSRSRRHAPHLIDAEVGNVLRRHERAGLISPAEAHTGLLTSAALIDQRYPHTGPVAALAWPLRENLTFYDAMYVAVATLLDVPLLTADARLSGAPELPCTVELV